MDPLDPFERDSNTGFGHVRPGKKVFHENLESNIVFFEEFGRRLFGSSAHGGQGVREAGNAH